MSKPKSAAASAVEPVEGAPGSEPVVDLLGLLALGGLARFARVADDAARAADVPSRLRFSRIAAAELQHVDALAEYASELGGDLDAAMAAHTEALADLDARTVPSDRWEGLITTYIAYGVVADLERELASALGERVAHLVADTGITDQVVAELEPVLAQDSQLGSRLALWGRVVVGEALTFAQAVLVGHPGLLALIGGEQEPAAVTRLLSRLAGGHARRMDRLGLTA